MPALFRARVVRAARVTPSRIPEPGFPLPWWVLTKPLTHSPGLRRVVWAAKNTSPPAAGHTQWGLATGRIPPRFPTGTPALPQGRNELGS